MYVSEVPDTTLTELAYRNAFGVETIRFEFNNSSARILDLTNPTVAKLWRYTGGDISRFTQNLGERASSAGYDAIRYSSERGVGANIAVLNNFDELLVPKLIFPTPRMPGL